MSAKLWTSAIWGVSSKKANDKLKYMYQYQYMHSPIVQCRCAGVQVCRSAVQCSGGASSDSLQGDASYHALQSQLHKESYPQKKSASIWTLSKGGEGGPTRIQIVRGTFFLLWFGHFPRGGGGGLTPIQKLLRHFSAQDWTLWTFCFCTFSGQIQIFGSGSNFFCKGLVILIFKKHSSFMDTFFNIKWVNKCLSWAQNLARWYKLCGQFLVLRRNSSWIFFTFVNPKLQCSHYPSTM